MKVGKERRTLARVMGKLWSTLCRSVVFQKFRYGRFVENSAGDCVTSAMKLAFRKRKKSLRKQEFQIEKSEV